MSLHLRTAIGAYRLLIPATSVLDVWSEEQRVLDAPTWRGRVLPYVDGRMLLEEDEGTSARSFVAYGDGVGDARAAILGVDAVSGSVTVSAEMLKPFPPTLAAAYRLFDATATLPGEAVTLLRLRGGLDLAALTEIRVPSRSLA